jgi:acetyl esterase/lipase
MLTLQNTFDELMAYEAVRQTVGQFIPAFILELVQPEQRGLTLAELKEAVRLPWGAGFPSEDLLVAANFGLELAKGDKYELVPLWKLPERDGSVYLIAPARKACTSGAKKPVAVICPGGAYSTLAIPSEGIAYADALMEKGFVPFVLAYSVAPNRYPQPHEDLALAIKYVRKNSEDYGLNPEELMLIGSSAGGHLCASFAAAPEEYERILMEDLKQHNPSLAEQYKGIDLTPQRLAICYPAISFMDLPDDNPCYFALTGGDSSLREKLSVETQVTVDYPKTFIWACEDDELVPVTDHAVRLHRALAHVNAESRLCLYPTGGHGCGLGNGTSAAGWLDLMLEYMQK